MEGQCLLPPTLKLFLVLLLFLCSVLALGWSLTVDWYFYQKVIHTYNTLPADKPLSSLLQLVFVQWRFLMFNVLKGHSAMFGTHPWHWYKTLQQLPLTLATILSPKVSESGSSSCPGNLSTTALHSPVLQQSPQYTGSTGSGRLDCSGI